MMVYDGQIIVGYHFFFPLFFSLLPDEVNNCPIYFLFFSFNPHSFDFLFRSYSFYKVLFVFNVVLQL